MEGSEHFRQEGSPGHNTSVSGKKVVKGGFKFSI